MNKYIVTFEWTALAIISMHGLSREEVEKKLLEVFPHVVVRSVKEADDASIN